MQGNSGSSSQEQSPSQFAFVFPSTQLLWEAQDSQDNRHLGNEEGLLARGPGPDFLRPDIEEEPGCGVLVAPDVLLLF